jgi:HSP20 family protein
MVRIRRSLSHPMLDIHRRMEQVMERLLRDVKPVEPQASWLPRADVYETAEGFVVTLELPGVEKEEIDILVEGLYLHLSGVRPEPLAQGCMRWHQMEIAHGHFERVLALPQEADPERITATYKDGFLMIRIPRGSSGARSVPIDET